MKVIKPFRLSVLHRPYRWQGKSHLGVTVLALADMGAAPRLRPETELWQLVEAELKTSGGILDLAIPKACAEFLATGYAYTHHQNEKTACAVKIQIENLEKTLLIFGDRHWSGSKASSPLPFQQMRLDWSRAFGGSDYPENPYGIGASEEIVNKTKIRRLPNIESIQQRLVHPGQKVEPVSFSALDLMWPSRFSRIGKKYDSTWLQQDFPGFARDIDWRLFNTAPCDQWWENRDALPAQARWHIWNMHPNKPLQEGYLPPWHARCFVNRVKADAPIFEEIALRATTVWFFPHLEQMVLIWHGSCLINEDDAADVLQLIPALEHIDSPRPISHYHNVLQQRMDKEKGALFVFREKDLLPEEAIGPWLDTDIPESNSPSQANLQVREQLLRDEYRKHRPESDINNKIPMFEENKLSRLEELPEFVDKMEKQAEKMRLDALQQLDEVKQGKNNTPHVSRGPESMHNILDMLHTNKHALSEKKLAEISNSLHQMYLLSVQSQQPATQLSGDLAQIIRNRALATMKRDRNFSTLDFTGADFSDMDLSGADFSHALLEHVNFSRCQLDGTNFTEAVLARANFSHASLKGGIFDKANLSLTQCRSADFSSASFKETQLQEALLDECIFDQSHWHDMMLNKTYMFRCRFNNALLENILFHDLTISVPDFSYSQLTKCSFIRCVLERAGFEHTHLESCSWIDTDAQNIRFHQARLMTCAFAADTKLISADFSHATLIQSNLRQMPLIGAIFNMSKLDGSDLSEADCRSANMQNMNAAGSLFIRTDLRSATMNGSNLMGALMQKCRLSGTDLRNTNLFHTDISQSSIDATTRLDGAYTHRVKTLPKRPQELV